MLFFFLRDYATVAPVHDKRRSPSTRLCEIPMKSPTLKAARKVEQADVSSAGFSFESSRDNDYYGCLVDDLITACGERVPTEATGKPNEESKRRPGKRGQNDH